jgi:tRNA(fMet)-specific endonuclease VapC
VTTRYLLDTNVVAFHVRSSSPALQARLRKIRAGSVALSIVTEMEVRYGLARNPGLRIAPLVEGFLAGITILPVDSTVAAVYAKVRAALEAKGRPIGPLDLMIAAHALAVRATLVTNNVREFRSVPGLAVEDWTR